MASGSSPGSAWLGGSDRGAHRAEPGGLAAGVLEGRAGVGVDQVALGDVGVGPLHQQARVLPVEQRAGDSARPQVDALARVLGDLVVDDHIGDLQPPPGRRTRSISSRTASLSGTRSMTPLEMTTSTDASRSGSASTSASCSSMLARPMAPPLSRARASIAGVMSTPMTRPDGPVICAAMSRSVPAPQPRSSTTAPGSMPPSVQWFATPAKLSTVASGTRASSGSG